MASKWDYFLFQYIINHFKGYKTLRVLYLCKIFLKSQINVHCLCKYFLVNWFWPWTWTSQSSSLSSTSLKQNEPLIYQFPFQYWTNGLRKLPTHIWHLSFPTVHGKLTILWLHLAVVNTPYGDYCNQCWFLPWRLLWGTSPSNVPWFNT